VSSAASLPAYPFEAERLVGTIVEIGPDYAKVNLPLAAQDEPQLRHGERVGAGEVGEFVIVESGDIGIFARLSAVRLPERDRLSVQPEMRRTAEPHPVGTLQLLCSVPVAGGGPVRGIVRHPRIGARVYSLHASTVAWIAEHAGGDEPSTSLRLSLAQLPGTATAGVRITPERLFGRHCAVLGATGGGKSWTLARIVESCSRFDAKVLLIDATGEYHEAADGVMHVSLGNRNDAPDGCRQVALPYQALVEEDLFALFRPGGQVQGPKLREAMKSLKLASVLGEGDSLVSDGCIPKAGRARGPFEDASKEHADALDAPAADFDIERLADQVTYECVWPSSFASGGRKDYTKWGDADQQAYSHCTSLVSRIEGYVAASQFAPLLRPGVTPSVFDAIDEWLRSETPVLRVSLRHLAFAADVREIAANGLARVLLDRARRGVFEKQPLVVCLDEAHQFLNKALGDEYTKYPLDAFDLVAKEGRKYSLSLCIATQRPRDIPDAVLGQMGTLLVHRLTHDADRRVVERAAGDIDKSAAAFLPTLAPGQALLLGVDYPIPLVISITPPTAKPDSKGPDYQKHWRARGAAGGDSAEASDLGGSNDEPEPGSAPPETSVDREQPAVE
jgi:Helicase HerA, central domain/Helicase HerA-like C-terminal